MKIQNGFIKSNYDAWVNIEKVRFFYIEHDDPCMIKAVFDDKEELILDMGTYDEMKPKFDDLFHDDDYLTM